MAFKNIRFPTGIRYGAATGHSFSTAIAKALNGGSQRNSLWDYPLRKFQVERGLRTKALREAFNAHYLVCNGPGDTFRARDPNDYEVDTGQGVFTALGGGTYQMWKRFTAGAYTKDIPVYLPVDGTIVVNGGALIQTTHWTLNYTTPSGVLNTVGSPPATPVSWTGEYDIHVRFEEDDLMVTIEDEEWFIAKQITMVEEPNLE